MNYEIPEDEVIKNEIVQSYSQAADRFKTFTNYIFWLTGGAILVAVNFAASRPSLRHANWLVLAGGLLIISIFLNLLGCRYDGRKYNATYVQLTNSLRDEAEDKKEEMKKYRKWATITQTICMYTTTVGVLSVLIFIGLNV